MALTVMDKPKIYIAGGFYGDYKRAMIVRLSGAFELFDPEEAPQMHHIPGVYVGRDLTAIRDCEYLLAVQSDYPYLFGMAAEIGYATALDIPVIYVCLAPRVDSFLSGLARATFTDLDAACSFIVARYLPKSAEIKTVNQVRALQGLPPI